MFLGNALFLITGIDKKYKTYKAYKIMYLKKNRHQTRLVFVLKVYKFTGGVGGGAASKKPKKKEPGIEQLSRGTLSSEFLRSEKSSLNIEDHF